MALLDTGKAHFIGRREALDPWDEFSGQSLTEQLGHLVAAGDFVWSLRRSAQLAPNAARSSDPAARVAELVSFAGASGFSSLLAMESLAVIPHSDADAALVNLLSHSTAVVRRHAAWRLAERAPVAAAFGPLVEQLTWGGVDTMHAHRTLRRWALVQPDEISVLITAALAVKGEAAERSRLVDLLGVVSTSPEVLLRIAADPMEVAPARVAAIGALGGRGAEWSRPTLMRLAGFDDEIGAHAALALQDLGASSIAPALRTNGGLRLAQLVLASGLDGQLSRGGKGDVGGVASLMVSLGEALARRDEVASVITIGGGTASDALTSPLAPSGDSLTYSMIAFGDEARPAESPSDGWEHLPAIERGIRRILKAGSPLDMLHLRMADVGTLAGASAAKSMGVPVCFSVAPDPHNVVQSLQERNELDEDAFLALEAESHIWFRSRLVERLTREAHRLALFPRSQPTEVFEILGTEVSPQRQRVAVIAEGVDVDLIRRTEARHDQKPTKASKLRDVLDDLSDRIAPERRGLPLLLSVGRLHPVKGMERVVDAWASDPHLHQMCNLVVLGGDLANPSATERTVLESIDGALPAGDPRRVGLVLLGGRARTDIAQLLVAVAIGHGTAWAGGGVYVDGALKEEFGLALLEALAAGLVVTAPTTGGPPTYIDHGYTGVLVDPAGDLSGAIREAFELVERPGRARRAKAMVEQHYSIDTMASRLAKLYEPEPEPALL